MKRYIKTSEYDMYDGHRYYISGEDPRGQMFDAMEDDPVEAIEAWFRIGRKCKMNTAITTQTRDSAIKLVEAATPELLERLYSRYGCPTKLDYLIEACERQVARQCSSFYENEFGDQVHPFDVG